jgi:hypothetical protein
MVMKLSGTKKYIKEEILKPAITECLVEAFKGYNKNDSEIDIHDYLDISQEQKVKTAIDIINNRLTQPESRYQVLKYILNNLNKTNMSGTMKMKLRDAVMENKD